MKVWDDKRTAKLVELVGKGWSYGQIASYLCTSRSAIAGKCAKLGLKGKKSRTAEETLAEFAEELANRDCVISAGAAIGVSGGQARNLFTQLRKVMGRQAV